MLVTLVSWPVSLAWAIDFNMNPLCSVLLQARNGRILILEEMILPDSNTLAACEEFLSRTQKWQNGFPMDIYVYGDATGEQRKTYASRTDWQIVKDFLGFVTRTDIVRTSKYPVPIRQSKIV